MIRVGFALLSNLREPIPSTRIACLNVWPSLRAQGCSIELLFQQDRAIATPDVTGLVDRAVAARCDVVVLQKIYGPSVLEAVQQLRAHGIATVYSVCDFVDNKMAAAADRTAVVTAYLRSLYAPALQARIDVVHDGIERPELQRDDDNRAQQRQGGPRAVLVSSHPQYALPLLGTPPAGWHVDVVGQFAAADTLHERWLHARWALTHTTGLAARASLLKAILHPRLHHQSWQPQRVYSTLAQAQAGIIPIDTSDLRPSPYASVPAWKLKSENRLTLLMAMGLPVIATPIPAYEDVLVSGTHGFFASSVHDWKQAFHRLRDPLLRDAMGRAARAAVIDRFSVERQGSLLYRTLQQAVTDLHGGV